MLGLLLMLSVGGDFGSHRRGGLVVSITLCHACWLHMVSSVYLSFSTYLLASIHRYIRLYYNADDLSIHIIVHQPKVEEEPAKNQPASLHPYFSSD